MTTPLSRQRGSMLLVVLFLAGLLGVFAAVAASAMHAAAESSRTFANGLRADEAMRGAMDYVIAQTGSAIQQSRGTASIQMGRVKVLLRVSDEAARIDINRAPPELLTGIFRQVGVPADVAATYAARIVDWRDQDDKVSPNGGAELGAYRSAGRTDGPRNGPFLSVAELGLVLGIPMRTAASVAPYVTVASGRDKVNPMYADPPVLMAIPGIDENRVRDFLEQRKQPGADLKSLISRLGPVQSFVTEQNGAAVRFEGSVLVDGGDERHYEVVASVRGGDTSPYRIIAWDENPPARIRALP
jgi:general secretion pathway protein K